LLALFVCSIALWWVAPVWGASDASTNTNSKVDGWSRELAAHYLDGREIWWQGWSHAQKDNGTICISCHTVVPYAMARAGLRRELAESGMSTPEKTMLASVEKRVAQWSQMATFYSDAKSGAGKTAESHATEAVLNAVILASYDARLGHLRPITRVAFENAWALQETAGDLAGAWKWQQFHLGPWESAESNYQGAALLMVMAANAPDGFADEAEERVHLDRVKEYLRRNYAAQPVINQLYVLWASKKQHALLSRTERKTLLTNIKNQQQMDGGWRTAALDKATRADKTPEPNESDGYATGLAVLAMETSGVGHRDKVLKTGVQWLKEHQQDSGAWIAMSINKKRDPKSDAYLFMTDASTAYAVMALENSK